MTIRVLVVDDSSFMRKLISDILISDSEIEVIGFAENGLSAIKKIKELKPDVVTLDIKLPDISGLDVLHEVMTNFPTPVIVISAYAKEGAEEFILAYEYGALDVLTKPSGEISLDISKIKEKIIDSVKIASRADVNQLMTHKKKKLLFAPIKTEVNLIVIGASTGGPQAIFRIISELPQNLPVPIVIIQHMPEFFTKNFSERLNSRAHAKVKLAEDGETLKNGFVYVAPGGHNLEIKKKEELIANKEIINLLLNCYDALETMIDQVTGGNKENFDTSSLLKNLDNLMKAKAIISSNNETRVENQAEKKSEEQEHLEGEEGEKLADAPESLRAVKFVKIGIDRLDKLMNLVGELLISKMRLEQIRDSEGIKILNEVIEDVSKLVSDLQYEVMQSRLIPVGQIFNRFPRMVRDIAEREHKKVNFTMQGSEIELDRTVIDKLGEPLVHLLRNSVDHGIEPGEERKKAGKKEEGNIVLSARKEKNSVFIEVQDDGAGFNIKRIKEVALKRGVVSQKQLDSMSDKKIMMLPLNAGFSTSEKVSDVSGRGVGLDVVKTKISELNGAIDISSEMGKGTKFIITLPLTLAIIKCFLVQINNEIYGIPLNNIVRTAKINRKSIKTIENYETFVLNEEDIPLLRLHELLGIEEIKKEDLIVVIVEKTGESAGLSVDKIIGQQDLIIKPLESSIKRTKGFSGTTILGDGRVALIIDVNSLI